MPRRTIAAVLMVLVGTTVAHAQTGKSAAKELPNGRPFQQIQDQIAQMQQATQAQLAQMQQATADQIHALQVRIDAVESSLQTQINSIYGGLDSLQDQVGGLQDQIVTVADGVAALQERLAASDRAIAALEAAVNDLRAQLDAVRADIASNTGDIAALQSRAASLQTLIGAHDSQIAALRSQDTQINQFLASMVNATCQSGYAISDIGPGGIISCTRAASTGGALSSYTTFVAGSMGANAISTMRATCQPGYTATGGGYYRATFHETVQYVSNLNIQPMFQWFYSPSGWQQLFTGHFVQPTYGYMQRDPISIVSDRAGGGYYQVEFLYTPQSGNLRPYFEVWATCARVN